MTISSRYDNIQFKLKNSSNRDKVKLSNYFEYWNNPNSYDKFKDKWDIQLSNNSSLLLLNKWLKNEMKGVGRFIKILSIYRFHYSFYFISPIVFYFTNLIILNFKECAFPLLRLLKIGEQLKNLKTLNLTSVDLVGFSKQELSLEDAYLPYNLEELTIERCRIYNMYSVANTITLVQHNRNNMTDDLIYLQGLRFQSLKKLTLDLVHDKRFVLKLLKFNPLVEDLTICSGNMMQQVIDLISITDKIANITIISDESFPYITNDIDFEIPKFSFIKELKLQFRCKDEQIYYQPQNITECFPNLTQLTLDITDIGFGYFNYNEFILLNLSSFNRLDKLVLKLNQFGNDFGFLCSILKDFPINWSNFSNVNCLIIDSNYLAISDIEFGALPIDLNEVRVAYSSEFCDLRYIGNNIDIFQNWDIKFKNGFIHLTKK